MISALNQTDAKLHMRRAEMARLLRRGVALVALTCVGVNATYAQRNSQRDDTQQVPHSERFQLPRDVDNRADARAYDARAYEAREEQRRQAQMQQEQMRNAENMRKGGRMTPDERRDLRRQINEAGMDLYQNPPRR